MIAAKLAENEELRLEKLRELNILDTLEEQAYDDLTQLAAHICNTPIALVSLVDESRQWFKSHHGLDARETPRDYAFCGHAILNDELFVVEDADKDKRFHDNPLVTGGPLVKFYAGAPLVVEGQYHVGTLCVIDHHARNLSERQCKALQALARQVVSQLELRIKVKELKGLDHAKDEFLSMISHELRTPLTSIKGALGLISHFSQELPDNVKSMLDISVRNTDQLLVIVNDILDLAKMEAGKFDIEVQQVDLIELLQQSLKMNNSYVELCGCSIVFNLPDTQQKLSVKADPQRIQQVISNLISNAAKFSPSGSEVELMLSVHNHKAKVSVVDHGTGIPVENQAKLFEKFKQISGSANTKLPGTGLGLNICKHIIDAHNGEIGFESVPGEYTEFFFTLDVVE